MHTLAVPPEPLFTAAKTSLRQLLNQCLLERACRTRPDAISRLSLMAKANWLFLSNGRTPSPERVPGMSGRTADEASSTGYATLAEKTATYREGGQKI